MDYNEAVKFLFNSIPNYQNKGKTALRPGLKNIKSSQNILKILIINLSLSILEVLMEKELLPQRLLIYVTH